PLKYDASEWCRCLRNLPERLNQLTYCIQHHRQLLYRILNEVLEPTASCRPVGETYGPLGEKFTSSIEQRIQLLQYCNQTRHSRGQSSTKLMRYSRNHIIELTESRSGFFHCLVDTSEQAFSSSLLQQSKLIHNRSKRLSILLTELASGLHRVTYT